MLLDPVSIDQWATDNSHCFAPPIMNKLMHKKQLTIMFVGGPNTRTDFHVEGGSELFIMMKGNMQLPTVQQGKRKLVDIKEGHLFVLPPRIPHSPQRPEAGSLGLVIERERVEGEMDCLRWYTDFDVCTDVLWERFFRCDDLGKDLVPVVQAFKASQECSTGKPSPESVCTSPPLEQDTATAVPDPIKLSDWVDQHASKLAAGEEIDLLASLSHPDPEFRVIAAGEGTQIVGKASYCETWLYQLRGSAVLVDASGAETEVGEGCCCLLAPGEGGAVKRGGGSVGLLVQQRPGGCDASRGR